MANQLFTNVTCGDDYTEAATIRDVFLSGGGSFEVQNNDVAYQLEYGTSPQAQQGSSQWTRETFIGTGGGTIPAGVTGIRFRNALAGSNAVVSAVIFPKDEPYLSLTFPSPPALQSQMLTGDYKVSAIGATHTDPAGGTWYLCDGSAIPAGNPGLVAIFGTNFPDARGRLIGMEGPNAAMAFGANDGQAAANRRTFHRTSQSLGFSGTLSSTAGESNGHTHSPGAGGTFTTDTPGSLVFAYSGGGFNVYQQGSTSGPSSDHSHQFTPAGSITGSVGTNNGNDALDTPSFIVPGNLFVHS